MINHADLAATLPELSPASSLRRVRYLVQMRRDDDGRIKAIRIHSATYNPILERRFVYPDKPCLKGAVIPNRGTFRQLQKGT